MSVIPVEALGPEPVLNAGAATEVWGPSRRGRGWVKESSCYASVEAALNLYPEVRLLGQVGPTTRNERSQEHDDLTRC